jgi:16S rRNA (uracil1498-N3)-methyltransferase
VANLYLSDNLTGQLSGATATLEGAEARHAVTVTRVAIGDRVTIGDGLGTIATGVVVAATASTVNIELHVVEFTPQPAPAIWLAQALAKGDRDELAVQAATELGVDGVIPWAAARSISRWEGAKVGKGHERWTSIVREASKQSVRPWLPEVGPLTTTRQLAALAETAQLLVLDPLSEVPLTRAETRTQDARDIVLVVGPEGGIAPGELELLYGAGAWGASLGSTILRTSTAGPAAIAVLNAKLGRW